MILTINTTFKEAMILTINTTFKEEVFVKRIQDIFGLDRYISEPGANLTINSALWPEFIGQYRSLGTGNNVAYKKCQKHPGRYYIWLRNELYSKISSPLTVNNFIEGIL